MYIKNPYARILLRGDRIVLCNTKTGAFVRTAARYYAQLETCMQTKDQTVRATSKDQDTLKYLFSELCKIEFYIPEERYDEVFRMPVQVVYLSLTNRCNLKCKHCVASAADPKGEDPLSTEDWKAIIIQVLKLRPEQLALTGGEPLLRKDFLELLRFAKENCKDTKIVLSTNGLLISDKNVKDIIDKVDTIAISLDGYDETSCEKIRGKGVYRKVIDVISLIKANGYSKISLSMLESAYTEGHDAEFYALCKTLGVEPITRRFSPTGRGKLNRDELMPTTEDEQPIQPEKLRCMLCHPGRKELDIAADGTVYPCAPLSEKKELCMGNLREKSLSEIMEPCRAEALVEGFRPWNMNVCKDCDVNLFCHSCMNYMIGIRQDTQHFERICSQTKAELEKIVWED